MDCIEWEIEIHRLVKNPSFTHYPLDKMFFKTIERIASK